MASPLGKLETVELREQWPDEAHDFTPWLANHGLKLLGETIGAELVLVKREASVGPFSADIVARIDEEEEHLAVIENQLERTNHDHLGKLIAYASGIGARTVVWIAKEFTEEHRQSLDWLNNLEGNVSFFGLQVQLLRIGGSPAAPQFRVISSPNTWTKEIKKGRQAEPSETKIEQRAFWQDLADYMRDKHTFLSLKSPPPRHWYTISLGRGHFQISLTVNSRLSRAGCEIWMGGDQAKQAFDLLHEQKAEIETEFDHQLDWQRLENRKGSRIIVFHDGSISNSEQREELKAWMHTTAEDFHRVFSPRILALELAADDEDGEEA